MAFSIPIMIVAIFIWRYFEKQEQKSKELLIDLEERKNKVDMRF